MVEAFGCPMHFGVSDEGLKESISQLNRRFPALSIREIPEEERPEEGIPRLKNRNSVIATCERIAAQEDRILKEGNTPLFFGGDHAAAMGTVAGSALHTGRLGLLWIDAHTDINTDTTTITGNIHGMPVSALLGHGDAGLCSIYQIKPKVRPEDVVFFGIRDMDPPEEELVKQWNIRCYLYSEIEERGLEVCFLEALERLRPVTGLHVSFDLDSMDPAVIRGVTVPVPGGFREEDVFLMFNLLQRQESLLALDIVEYNPVYDTDGHTGDFVRLLAEKITGR